MTEEEIRQTKEFNRKQSEISFDCIKKYFIDKCEGCKNHKEMLKLQANFTDVSAELEMNIRYIPRPDLQEKLLDKLRWLRYYVELSFVDKMKTIDPKFNDKIVLMPKPDNKRLGVVTLSHLKLIKQICDIYQQEQDQ